MSPTRDQVRAAVEAAYNAPGPAWSPVADEIDSITDAVVALVESSSCPHVVTGGGTSWCRLAATQPQALNAVETREFNGREDRSLVLALVKVPPGSRVRVVAAGGDGPAEPEETLTPALDLDAWSCPECGRDAMRCIDPGPHGAPGARAAGGDLSDREFNEFVAATGHPEAAVPVTDQPAAGGDGDGETNDG